MASKMKMDSDFEVRARLPLKTRGKLEMAKEIHGVSFAAAIRIGLNLFFEKLGFVQPK